MTEKIYLSRYLSILVKSYFALSSNFYFQTWKWKNVRQRPLRVLCNRKRAYCHQTSTNPDSVTATEETQIKKSNNTLPDSGIRPRNSCSTVASSVNLDYYYWFSIANDKVSIQCSSIVCNAVEACQLLAGTAALLTLISSKKKYIYNCVEDRKSKLNSTYKQTTRDSVGLWAFMMRHSYANPSEPHSNGVGQIVIYIVTSRFFVRTYRNFPSKLLVDFIASDIGFCDIMSSDVFKSSKMATKYSTYIDNII